MKNYKIRVFLAGGDSNDEEFFLKKLSFDDRVSWNSANILFAGVS
jgi:hypothetical protein